MTSWVRVEHNIASDIWPHLSALFEITAVELIDILHNEFTSRQTKDLRRELGRLRRAYVKLSIDKLIEEAKEGDDG